MDQKNKKNDIQRARRFANNFRLIDDLTVLNDGGEFEIFKEICPPQLELKKENDINTECSFSDIIKIRDNKQTR